MERPCASLAGRDRGTLARMLVATHMPCYLRAFKRSTQVIQCAYCSDRADSLKVYSGEKMMKPFSPGENGIHKSRTRSSVREFALEHVTAMNQTDKPNFP